MKIASRIFTALALLTTFSLGVQAQPALYVDGTHYTTLDKPVRTVDPNRIEVTEVFWYGCPHCFAFEPMIENYEQNLPEDVVFVRSPGMWNGLMEIHAQIYYAAEELGVLHKTHEATFSAIHQQGNYLQNERDIKKFFMDTADVSGEDFDKAWASFGVNSAVKRASTRMRDYGVRGVPNLVVNGKYRVEVGSGVATQADMLKVVNFLIQKERSGS